MKINTIAAPVGALILLALYGPALAVPAMVVAETNLFVRPRAGAAALAGLPVGTMVDLQRCEQLSWCLIHAGGRKGWVPMAALFFEVAPETNAAGGFHEGGKSGGAPGQPKLVGSLQNLMGEDSGPKLVGGLQNLLGDQDSGPKLKKAPGVTVATSISRIPPHPAPDQAKLKVTVKHAND